MMGMARASAGDARASLAVDLADVASAPRVHLPSGDPLLDQALGGGWVKGRLYLLAGVPGSGKTTRLLRSCAAEHLRDVCRVASIRPRGVRVIPVETLADVVSTERADLVVIDSISVMQEGALLAMRRARRMTRRGACVVAIAQSTKAGDFRGAQSLGHDGDATLWLGRVDLVVEKSRCGPMGTFPVTPFAHVVAPSLPANDS
jgi:predicted ATP-dependent serine protease